MTIEAPPPSLNESLDYDATTASTPAAPAPPGRARGICPRTSSTRSEVSPPRLGGCPTSQPSKVADGDLPTKEDHQ